MQKQWHTMPVAEVLALLHITENGLSSADVIRRRERYGRNALEVPNRDGVFWVLFRQFVDPLTLILAAAGVISLVLFDVIDTAVIFAAVGINAVVGFFQERKVSAILSRLQKSVQEFATVRRDGRTQRIDADEVVPGDVVLLRRGDRMVADGRLMSGNNLSMDEAVLTGESLPVDKLSEAITDDVAVSDRLNMVYSGTLVAEGSGVVIVTETGAQTEFGSIAALVGEERRHDRTPLQVRFRRLAVLMGVIFVTMAAMLFGLGVAAGREPLMMFLTAVAVGVAAVPESLPVAVSTVLALGARRILAKGGLVRKMSAAETLGSVTVIATDKTATLTVGRMQVDHLELPGGRQWEVGNTVGEGEDSVHLLLATSNAFIENPSAPRGQWRFIGTPMDQAILRMALAAGIEPADDAARYRRYAELPFDAAQKYSAVLINRDGMPTMVILGAPERVMEMSAMTEEERDGLHVRIADLASKGLRVLAFAERVLPGEQDKIARTDVRELSFRGLLVLSDPVRPDVAEVIRTAQDAGIRIVMVTGDHVKTAGYIARQTGILHEGGRVIEGKDLPEDLSDIVRDYSVFARVSPEDKLRIVEALKAQKNSVAMIGDGVNDAPSLIRADIGVAVGSGTEVAKDASDLVLLGDGFRIIIEAIRQGRIIFDNIVKVLIFLLSDAFTELALVGTSIIAGLPLPLLPAQILWVNIIEDILPAIALAADRDGETVMREQPRDITGLFSSRFKWMILVFAVLLSALTLGVFLFFIRGGGSLAHAQTMTFGVLGITSLMYAFSVRSLHHPIWRGSPFKNGWLNGAVLVGVLLYGAAVYLPVLNRVLGTVPLHPADWGILFGVGLIGIGIFEIGKRFLPANHHA